MDTIVGKRGMDWIFQSNSLRLGSGKGIKEIYKIPLSKKTQKNIKNHKNPKKSLPEGKLQCRTLQFIKKKTLKKLLKITENLEKSLPEGKLQCRTLQFIKKNA